MGLGPGVTVVFLPGREAQADCTWNGSVNQDWNNVSDWTGEFPSGAAAIINTGSGNCPVIGTTPTSGIPADVFVGRSGTRRLDQTSVNVGIGSGNWRRDCFGLTTIDSGMDSDGTLNVSGAGRFNSAPGGRILGEGRIGTDTAAGTLILSGNGEVNPGTNGVQLGLS